MRPRSDTVLVWTGASCTYGCGACPIDPAGAPAGVQGADLPLAAGPASERRLAVLVGGEPFLRPDFLRLAAAIRGRGWVPGLVTTGRPLLYPQLRQRLRRAGAAYLRLQLFGVGAAHDRATATPGAFAQALAGLRAWLAEAGADCDVDVALTIRGRPIEGIASELELLAGEIPSPEVQIVVALDPATRAALRDTEPLRRTLAGLAEWNDDATRPLLVWEGFPPVAHSASQLLLPAPHAAFLGGAPRACCLGDVRALAGAAAGRDEATRANSFNFVRDATAVAWTATADACSAYDAAGGLATERHLWLVDGERLVLHATDTGDFAPAEIARVKEELSHLFVDRAPPGVLDDFTEGMRRVLPDPLCDACAQRARCGRRYRVVEGAPFAREEAWIAGYVGGLRGRVLDVGCGEQLYQDVLAPLVGSGEVEYHGLDPDERSLDRLRAAIPTGHYYRGGIEAFRDAPGRYDRIMSLRSLNHVEDLDEAMARMAELLRPGGELLLVETTPFAMLRRPEQVAAADRAPRAGHQHFRNVASEEVLPLARRRRLRVRHHQPIGRQATNQWILLLARDTP